MTGWTQSIRNLELQIPHYSMYVNVNSEEPFIIWFHIEYRCERLFETFLRFSIRMITFNLCPGWQPSVVHRWSPMLWTTEVASVSSAVVTSSPLTETACFMQDIAKAMTSMLFFV